MAAKPQSRADMDPNFEKRLRDLQQAGAAAYDQGHAGGQVRWFRPEGWAGDLFDLVALGTPFARDKANSDFLEAVKDPKNPGTTGDVVATTTMIDYLGSMERAFRLRHALRRPRATAHALGRLRGHGSANGPLIGGGLEYLRAVLKQAKADA